MFEIRTPSGFGYLQVTHKHEDFGLLVSVLPGLHQERPADLESLLGQPDQFRTFHPIDHTAAAGLAERVGHHRIPDLRSAFPVFRNGAPDAEGNYPTWWLWAGEEPWRAEATTEELRDLPLQEIINHALLVDRLQSGWTHRDHPAPFTDDDEPPTSTQGVDEVSGQTRFYLYFPSKRRATKAAQELRREGLEVHEPEKDFGGDWKLELDVAEGADVMAFDDRLEALAEAHGGEYDGSESFIGDSRPD